MMTRHALIPAALFAAVSSACASYIPIGPG
jgi:hypothetical protein